MRHDDLIQQLTALNPVPLAAGARLLSDEDSDAINVRARRLAAMSDLPAAARRSRRPALALAAILAGAALVATPAFGLHQKLVGFLEGEEAPRRVETAFGMLDVGAPPGMAPGVIAEQAREATSFPLSEGGRTVLWVAPTKTGGFCHFFSGALGGCRSKAENSAASPYVIGFGMTGPRGRVPFVIGGDISAASDVETLKLRFADGDETTIPIVWVSAPIEAGFYLYEVPREHWEAGSRPALLIGLGADGAEVARQALPTEFGTERDQAATTAPRSRGSLPTDLPQTRIKGPSGWGTK